MSQAELGSHLKYGSIFSHRQGAAGARLERMRRSPNYKEDRFENLVPTEVTVKGTSFFKMLKEYRHRPADTAPAVRMPSVKTELRALPDEGVWVVWFGHSSYLLKVEGMTILVDPVFSGNASPVSFLAKAFPGTEVYGVEEMPEIDVLLLTHDHYDHLDYKTIKRLAPGVRWVCTSLGVGAHFKWWGVAVEKIVELDWWESWSFGGDEGVRAGVGEAERVGLRDGGGGGVDGAAGALTLTAAPARHFWVGGLNGAGLCGRRSY